MQELLVRAQGLEEMLRGWRRHFHRYPELAFQEWETGRVVARWLREFGLRVQEAVGLTGVVAELGEGGPVVALRADMDALPIQEDSDLPYASSVPGVMHACGHDAHMAMLLGAACLLAQEPPRRGRVRFLFQPSEESVDAEGKSGARRMIEAGAMEEVEAVFALHVDANRPVGELRTRAGPFMAAVDPFWAQVRGKTSHGARPHEGVDPIAIVAQVLNVLYAIPSRRISPLEPCIVSVGALHAGSADNVIPGEVELRGTIRSFSPEVRERLWQEVERAFSLAQTLGGSYLLRIIPGHPVLENAPLLVALLRAVAASLLQKPCAEDAPLETGSEDFAWLARAACRGGAFAWLGARIEGDERTHHHPRFDIDERCLPLGTAILAGVAYRYLEER